MPSQSIVRISFAIREYFRDFFSQSESSVRISFAIREYCQDFICHQRVLSGFHLRSESIIRISFAIRECCQEFIRHERVLSRFCSEDCQDFSGYFSGYFIRHKRVLLIFYSPSESIIRISSDQRMLPGVHSPREGIVLILFAIRECCPEFFSQSESIIRIGRILYTIRVSTLMRTQRAVVV